MEIEDETGKEKAAEAKARGAALYAKADRESYEAAILAYAEAETHDPTDHVFPSNICACHLELCKLEYEPAKKLEHAARAFVSAERCSALNAAWVKGYVRKATAEWEVLSAAEKYAERKEQRTEPLDYDGKPWAEPEPSLLPVIKAASYASCEATCRAGLAIAAAGQRHPLIPEPGNADLRLRLQLLRDHNGTDNEEADRALVDVDAAAPLKAEGNTAFAAKNYADAAEKYTAALSFNPFDHIFYSNRSACYAGLEEETQSASALRDADRCIALMPSFAKGHSRRSVALFGLGRYKEAEEAAQAGLALDPASAPLKELLAAAQLETAESEAVQKQMHQMRLGRAKDEKMKKMLSGLNLGGNVQMFNGLNGLNGLGGLGGLGGNGMGNLFGGGGMQGPAQTDEQMRQMARAMAGATAAADTSGGEGGGGS